MCPLKEDTSHWELVFKDVYLWQQDVWFDFFFIKKTQVKFIIAYPKEVRKKKIEKTLAKA